MWEKVVHGENKIWESENHSDCVYNSGKITCCQCVLKSLKGSLELSQEVSWKMSVLGSAYVRKGGG